MPNFDLTQKAEHDGLWRALPPGSHKTIVHALMADQQVQNALAQFRRVTPRVVPAELSDRVCRLTGDLAGIIARNAVMSDSPVAAGNDKYSLWRALPPGTEQDVVPAVMHDPDLLAQLSVISDEYLVNRLSRMCGLAIAQVALTEAKSLLVWLGRFWTGKLKFAEVAGAVAGSIAK